MSVESRGITFYHPEDKIVVTKGNGSLWFDSPNKHAGDIGYVQLQHAKDKEFDKELAVGVMNGQVVYDRASKFENRRNMYLTNLMVFPDPSDIQGMVYRLVLPGYDLSLEGRTVLPGHPAKEMSDLGIVYEWQVNGEGPLRLFYIQKDPKILSQIEFHCVSVVSPTRNLVA